MTDAIVGHLVGDYLLQSDWQASGKKTRSWICAVHCLIWTACVCGFAGWYNPWAIAILFGAHFIQDRSQVIAWWMDAVGQKSFRTGVCAPWSAIVVDNVFHILTIWIVSKASV
jgi:hypothetical protein